jgi:membrane fusion protein (multidrug efflux system)
MDPLFPQTLRALETDAPLGARVAAAVLGVVLALGGAWGLVAELPVQVASVRAELRTAGGLHAVDAEAGGTLVRLPELGRTVLAGEVVGAIESAELTDALLWSERETEALRAAVAAGQARLEQAEASSAILERASELEAAVQQALAEAGAARSQLASQLAERSGGLAEQGVRPEEERTRAEADAEEAAAQAKASERRARVAGLTASLSALQQQADVEALRSTLRQLEAALARAEADRSRMQTRRARTTLRAPVDGQVAWVMDRPPGRSIAMGEPLFTVLESGPLELVAWFASGRALGPLQPGQEGVLRLDAYPWTTWGAVPVTVSAVARDPIEGLIRVQLRLIEPLPTTPHLEHGLSGTVLIEVERAAPLALALRSLGRAD